MAVRSLAYWLILAAPLLLGCGENTGTVSGKVLFQGEPLPSGTIAFQGAKGWVGSSNLQSGEYKISGVPPGEVQITVQTFPPSPGVVPPDTPASSVKLPSLKYTEIPPAYSDFSSTPLKLTVKLGTQTHDIVLTEDQP